MGSHIYKFDLHQDGTLEVPCHGDVPGAVPTESAAGADAVQASLGSITTGVESGTASHAEAVAGLAAGSSAPAADAAVTPAVEAAGEAVDAPDEAIQVAGGCRPRVLVSLLL